MPPETRSVFVVAATAAFAGFAVMGLFTAVAPSFIARVIGIGNHAAAGAIVASVFAASAITQVVVRRAEPTRAVAIGCAILVVGMLILAAALPASSLPLLIIGALLAGAGQGMSFGRGLAAVAERTPPDRRAEVSSTYFVVAYVAISLPVIGEGLAAQRWGLQTSGITFAIIVAAIAALCFVAVLVEEHRVLHAEAGRALAAVVGAGALDALELLDSQRSLVADRARLVDAEMRVAERQVELFRALGGGWQAGSQALQAQAQPTAATQP